MGTLVLGKDVIISDPCYEPGTWCMAEVNEMLPGEYICRMQMSDEGDWGHRVSAIKIVHRGCSSRKAAFAPYYLSNIGVDSGQCGFFDKEYFLAVNRGRTSGNRDDKEWEKWYENICSTTFSEKDHRGTSGIVDGKCFVSSSGYGDWNYSCKVKKDEDGNIFELYLKYI